MCACIISAQPQKNLNFSRGFFWDCRKNSIWRQQGAASALPGNENSSIVNASGFVALESDDSVKVKEIFATPMLNIT